MKKITLFLALFMVVATILVAQPAKSKPNLCSAFSLLWDKTSGMGYNGMGAAAEVLLSIFYQRFGAEIAYRYSTLKKQDAESGYNENSSAKLFFRTWEKLFVSAGMRHDYYVYRFKSGNVWTKRAYAKTIGIQYGFPHESHFQLEYALKENYTQNKRTSFSAELVCPLFNGNPRILLTNRFTLVRFSQLYQNKMLRLTGLSSNFGLSILWQIF